MFGLSQNETQSIKYGIILVLINIFLITILSQTPLSEILWILNGVNGLLVVIVYGILLTLGGRIAQAGILENDQGTALIGVAMLQFAYGTFGAAYLQGVALSIQAVLLAVTAVITTIIAVSAGVIIYKTQKDFSQFRKYSIISFIGLIIFAVIGAIFPPFFLLSFIAGFLGFLFLLIFQIWLLKVDQQRNPLLAGVGLYIAYMGLFIKILMLVLRVLSILSDLE